MKPALTKEEWEKFTGEGLRYGDPKWREKFRASMHRLTALCSHNQPFGFTREDVEAIRDIAEFEPTPGKYLNTIADRIKARLPPEEG